MLSLFLCSDHFLNSVNIQYTQGTHNNMIIMTMKQNIIINKKSNNMGSNRNKKVKSIDKSYLPSNVVAASVL